MKNLNKNAVLFVFPQNKKQNAEKFAYWIINSILKLPDDDLNVLYLLLEEELKKRGVF